MSLQLELDSQLGNFHLQLKAEFSSRGITGILGRSGSGKSTLLKAIAGFIDDDIGQVRWRGKQWQQGKERYPIEHRRIGFVSQASDLFPHLTVEQNLLYGFKRLGKLDQLQMQARYLELVELLGLQHLLERHCVGLSGGEQQKVALARALLSAPELLLLDEPLSALDEASKPEVLYFIRDLSQRYQLPALYVSHSFDEISYLADELFLMAAGDYPSPKPIEQMLLENPGHPALPGPMITLQVDPGNAYPELGFKEVLWAGQTLKVALACGQRLRLRSRDLTIWSKKPHASSALNLLFAQITAIDLHPQPGSCLVALAVNGQPLLATITLYSLKDMQLKQGQMVYLQIKASSFW